MAMSHPALWARLQDHTARCDQGEETISNAAWGGLGECGRAITLANQSSLRVLSPSAPGPVSACARDHEYVEYVEYVCMFIHANVVAAGPP